MPECDADADAAVDRVVDAVWRGMGMNLLHSAHFSKIVKKLMGTPCNPTWRPGGERERIWVTARGHPIARGLPVHFDLDGEEMYGELCAVPKPLETVFISWFQGGEVLRSGLTYRRGIGWDHFPAGARDLSDLPRREHSPCPG